MNQSVAYLRSAHIRFALRLSSVVLATVLSYWISFGQQTAPASPRAAGGGGTTYSIVATTGPNGSISPSGTVTVN